MRRLLLGLLATCLILHSSLLYAVRVSSIYQAKFAANPVSAEDKKRLAIQGLERVLVKVSGSAQVMQIYPKLQAALPQAETYLQSIKEDPNHLVQLHYDPDTVTQLLHATGAPIWSPNRPLILVLIAYEGPNHPMDIIDNAALEWSSAIKTAAETRGLPVILPVMDMNDMSQITTADIITQAIPSLTRATKRYASNALLLGVAEQNHLGLNIRWTLVMGKDILHWEIASSGVPQAFTTIMNSVADQLAARYASIPKNGTDNELTLRISNVSQQADLLRIMRALEALNPVSEVQLKSVDDNSVILHVILKGSQQHFMQAVSNNKRLLSITNKDPDDPTLLYHWVSN